MSEKQIVLGATLRDVQQWAFENNWSMKDVISITYANADRAARGVSTSLPPVRLPSWQPSEALNSLVERNLSIIALAAER
jgi:hypothetical protein